MGAKALNKLYKKDGFVAWMNLFEGEEQPSTQLNCWDLFVDLVFLGKNERFQREGKDMKKEFDDERNNSLIKICLGLF